MRMRGQQKKQKQRGFTLLELIIIISILVVIATATVLVLNPLRIMQESRDAARLNDLAALESAIGFADGRTALRGQALDWDGLETGSCFGQGSQKIFVSVPNDIVPPETPPTPPLGWNWKQVGQANLKNIAGNGWVPINFASAAGSVGSPITNLPVDPTNTFASGLYYTYTCGGSFELNAAFESTKYQEKYEADGGSDSVLYEVGSSLVLLPTRPVGGGPSAPTVTSPTVTAITATSATLGANVTSDGGAALTARGTCWGTTAAPTTNCIAEGGTTTGVFTQSQTGMTASTPYFYRGYATNSVGTSYSADGSFTTTLPPQQTVPEYAASTLDCVLDTSGAGTVAWSNSANAFSTNDLYASAAGLDNALITDYLKCMNFGFTIPAGATILGIVVGVERGASANNNGGVVDSRVSLVKGGVVQTTNKADTVTMYPVGAPYNLWANYGTSTDLWGPSSWSYLDINSASFGVVFAATKVAPAGTAINAFVDSINIIVHYQP